MPEMNFRGKRSDNGEWVIGCYAEFINYLDGAGRPGIQVVRQVPSSMDRMIPAWETELIEVDPATVGQYTGLKDKTQITEVCTADIIRDGKGRIGVVKFIPEHAAFLVLTKDGEGQCYQRMEAGNGKYLQDTEVIGNIHDNPELLGGKQYA